MKNTKIEWCDVTVNPVVGCKNNCEYCYARKLNNRFKFVPDFSKPQFFLERLEQLKSKKPKIIFMNSMSDIAYWDTEWIIKTYTAIENNPQHKYIFLTKNLTEFITKTAENNDASQLMFHNCKSVLIGETITGQRDFSDLDPDIINIEPIFEHIDIDWFLEAWSKFRVSYRWVIIGAETGNRKGKIVPKKEWIDDILLQCDEYKIPVFMKESLLPIMGEENMRREFPKELKRELGG